MTTTRSILPCLAVTMLLVRCFGTIVVPPVTITGQKTATERQIIGEQTELEKDVWMISSAKTSEHAALDAKPKEIRNSMEQENANTYRAFLKFDLFSAHLAQLKKDRVVGETNKGFVANLLLENAEVPAEAKKKYDSELADEPDLGRPYRTLIQTVKEINEARVLAARGYVESQKRANKEFKATEKEILASQKNKYQQSALKGEMIQADDGSWAAKE
ncbi:DUF1318 domain-containing protein [Turneriella parva]|uniref:DUF1318 domain-containing protein n=1 Tax=Turneriella parva (strain ATCC BAA-1111 / DSM 21527 / NCTC 11395 / H) TaxID=869212 RepID=I4B3R0_TURPD|nr:DUF1318 domain-containing protein [Turneriella parva]AFM11917.1 hypothetical protein Turpa_1269 [Turneriella parva DSM 21527]